MHPVNSVLFVFVAYLHVAVGQDGKSYPGVVAPPVYFDEYATLLGVDKLKRCIRRESPPENQEPCRGLDKVCMWGSQRCGEDNRVEPTTRCNCYDGEWTCLAFLCPTMEPTCPEEPPQERLICKTDLTCGYAEKVCPDCVVAVPTVQCSCEAGQPFTCQEMDPCEAGLSCEELSDATYLGSIFPKPVAVDRKIDMAPFAVELVHNSVKCPIDPPANGMESICMEGMECTYGFSCCCPDESQCSPDVKCQCVDGLLDCVERKCDAFVCTGPPPLLESPFPENEATKANGLICPPQEIASTTTTCTIEEDKEFYHCEYSFSCCCPDADDSFSGRYCSSDLQCTCNVGVFTCDAPICPECPVGVNEVECPEALPENNTPCPNPVGETCGFGVVTCCDGTNYAGHYCTCQGNGLWDCRDSNYLCDMASCVTEK